MRGPLIEIWDPSDEGEQLFEQLSATRFEVRAIDRPAIPLTRADLLIIAGDAEGALGALKLLRDEALDGDLPVILLGAPPGTHPRGDGPAFGADAVLTRPVSVAALVDKCDALLGGEPAVSAVSRVAHAPVERTLNLELEEPDSSQVLLVQKDWNGDSVRPWVPREPTRQLEEPSDEGGGSIELLVEDEDSGEVSTIQPNRGAPPVRESTGVRSGSKSGVTPTIDAPQPVIPVDRRAELSPWLVDLFHRADRRAFGDRAPLELHLPAAEERPEDLVPPELIERAVAFRFDEPVIEDPIDAFTYVGGPAIPPPVSVSGSDPDTDEGGDARPPRSASAPPPEPTSAPPPHRPAPPSQRHEVTTAAEVLEASGGYQVVRSQARVRGAWPEDDTVLGRADAEGTRHGVLGPGGALRLLFRVATLGLDALLTLRAERGPSLRMTFVAGELRALEGPVARRALKALRLRHLTSAHASEESAAEAVLQQRVDEQRLSRFERDRLLREAREQLLSELAGAERAEFELRRLDDTQPGRELFSRRVLSRPLRAALVDAARDALSEERVNELLGPNVALSVSADRERAFAPAELSPEVTELILRMDGSRLSELLAAAPSERGLAGVIYLLVAADALELSEATGEAAAPTASRAAVTHLLEVGAQLALDGDYFSILGVERSATDADIERAYESRRSEVVSLPLVSLGLTALDERRAEILDALDEAHSVLRATSLRRAYAAGLP